jgi:uncharacterized protein YdaU (DUF1376 family)
MKAPSPAFSLYPKDILSDEACSAMTDEELGVYVRLLCHAWLEGSIPADRVRLARMTRRSLSRFERVWRAVGPCWDTDPWDPDRLVQRRMERERTKQVTYSELQSRRAQSREATRDVSPSVPTKRSSRGSAGSQPEASRIEAGSSLPSPSPSPSPFPSPYVGRKEEPLALPPADRAERAIRLSTDALRTKLYGLIDAMAREDPDQADPTELMRMVTAYDKPDGSRVKGVVNAALLTHERLERSIADAETQLAEWGAARGTATTRTA